MAYDDMVLGTATNSKIIEVMLRDNSTGQAKTSVAYGSVTYSFIREGDNANRVSGTCVLGTLDTYTDHGWIETGVPGVYQFGVPQAALAAGKNAVTIKFTASGSIDVCKRILIGEANLRTVFSGVSSVAKWLRGLFRVSTMDSTAKAEVNLGGGTYDESTDSAEALGAKTANLTWITSGTVVLAPPVADSGTLTIIHGDGYTGARALTWTVEDYAGGNVVGAAVDFRLLDAASYAAGDNTHELEVSGSATMSGADAIFTVSLSSTQTDALLSTAPPDASPNYVYQLEITPLGEDPATIAFGSAIVQNGIV